MRRYYVAYYLTLTLFFLLSFWPVERLWGVNHWTYLPMAWRLVLLTAAAVVPLVFSRIRAERSDEGGSSARWYGPVVGAVIAALTVAFVLFRARTHFTGDGYLLISHLATNDPSLDSPRRIVIVSLVKAVYAAISGAGKADAEAAFQIVSVSAGVILLSVAGFLSARVARDRLNALLLFLGVATGGYMAVFFGYVETYPLFITAVVVYILGVYLWARGDSLWWSAPLSQLAAVAFHIMGAVLLPVTAYLFVEGTRARRRWKRSPRWIRWSVGLTAIAIGLALFAWKWSSDPFFRFAFVSPLAHRYTLDGYTLFSWSHLGDVLSEVMVVFPALGLLLVLLLDATARRGTWRHRPLRIVALAGLLCLAVAFVLDPKLGMPRDWDLFAFSIIPLSVLLFIALLGKDSPLAVWRHSRLIAIMAITLGLVSLVPRIHTLVMDTASLERFRDYLELDHAKSRNGWLLLVNYYRERGDSATAFAVQEEWRGRYPERAMMERANELYYRERNLPATVGLLRQVIEIAPAYSDAYDFLGMCLLDMRHDDSALALLRIADGLCPLRATTLSNLGVAYHRLGDLEVAEAYYRKAVELDSTAFVFHYNLARLERERGRTAEYESRLERANRCPGVNAPVVGELVLLHLQRGRWEAAARALARSPELAADTSFVNAVCRRFPNVAPLIQRDGLQPPIH